MPKLDFSMQYREQSEWCWAAVSASISSYFGGPAGPAGGPWLQCQVASSVLGQPDCCADGSTASCNQDWYLQDGLTCVNHLGGPPVVGPSPFAYVQQEIDANRPVAVRIGWYPNQDDGHFVC